MDLIAWSRNSQSISLLSYCILEELDSKTFQDAYPSFANDLFANAYLNVINPDDIDEDLLLDDIVSIIISKDAVMRSILAYFNIPPAAKKVKIPEMFILGSHLFSYGILFGVKELNLFVKRFLEFVWIILLEIRVNFGWIFVFHFRYLKIL